MRQQRIVRTLAAAAGETASGRRALEVTVQPFDDAAGKCAGFGFRAREAAVELGDRGPIIEEGLPVLFNPGRTTRPQQFQDACLVARQEV
jgi:hypothetical protein